MNYELLLRALLEQAYKVPKTEIDSLLNESANEAETQTALLGIDSNRVNKIKEPWIGKFDQGRAAERKDLMSNLEKSLKEKYAIDSELQGVDLIEHIVTTKSETSKKTKDLTDDDVRKHSAYQTLEQKAKKELKEKEAEWETKLSQLETGIKKKDVFGKVGNKALEFLNSLNPVLPKNEKVAQNIKQTFVKSLADYEWEEQDGRFLAMKEGKVVDDGHGNTIDFEKLVKSKAGDFFEFEQNNGGSNGGNGTPGKSDSNPTPGYPSGINKPKSIDELIKIMHDSSVKTEDKEIVYNIWEVEQQNGTT